MPKNALEAGRDRYRRAASTAFMNIVAQVVQLATGLISVPLALHYVGAERFGIWMTLSTALAFITFSDFGVGIGMQDRISRLAGRGDYRGARNAFYSAFSLVSLIAISIMLVGYIVLPRLGLASLFSLKSVEGQSDIGPTAFATTAVIALGLLGGLVQRAFNALQEGFWVAVLQIIARFFSLVLLFVVVHFQLGLPVLVFTVGGLTSCVLLLGGIPVLLYRKKWLRLHRQGFLNAIDLESAKGLLSIGALGLGASVAIYLVNNSIPFLISSKYGAESVADFAVLMKLLAIPGMLLTYVLSPLWPAIAEANQKSDARWIRDAYRKCSIACVGIATMSGAIFLFGSPLIIERWIGATDLIPSRHLVVASITFMVLGFWNGVTSVVLNGLSRFKGQASYGLILAVAAVILGVVIPNTFPKEYVVWAINIGFAFRCVLMQFEVSRSLAGLSSKGASDLYKNEPSLP